MLPSLGYFRGIACPEEAQKLKCKRPYCHFRHKKNATATTNKKEIPALNIDVVKKAISQLKSGGDQQSKSFDNSHFKGSAAKSYAEEYESSDDVGYVPFSSENKSSEKGSVLRNAKGPSSNVHKRYTSKSSTHTTKNKYTSFLSSKPTTDLEYDPMSNYNCKDIQGKTKATHSAFSNSDDDDVLVISDDTLTAEDTSKPDSSSEEVLPCLEPGVKQPPSKIIDSSEEKKSDTALKSAKSETKTAIVISDTSSEPNKTSSSKLKINSPTKVSAETIKKFVDRDEIAKLEQELNGINTYEECFRIYQENETLDPDTTTSDEMDLSGSDAQVDSVTTEDEVGPPPSKFQSTLFRAQHRVALKGNNEPVRPSSTPAPKRKNPFAKPPTLDRKLPFKDIYRSSTSSTTQQTAGKGVRRMAHAANPTKTTNGSIPRPVITADRHSKVPTNIRQRYLSMFIDECLRICNNVSAEAYNMAQTEETRIKERSKTKSIYLSLAACTLKKLRTMTNSKSAITPPPTTNNDSNSTVVAFKGRNKRIAHGGLDLPNIEAKKQKLTQAQKLKNLNQKESCKGGFEFEMRETTQLTGEELYERMCNYIMTEDQLRDNGYPREAEIPGQCKFYNKTATPVPMDAKRKICQRCGKEFILSLISMRNGTECIHHWGRAYSTKVGSSWEKRYSCCQNTVGSEGCSVNEPGIYSLDCEMCYTMVGLELARVSVVDFTGKLVYDTFVVPEGKILDYNTRWSGLHKSDFVGVKTTLRHVQAVFLSKFSSDSILIGHSLESDLVALRIIHNSVVDTSIVFPHRLGPPYKRALRNLMSEHLGIVIQNAGDEGHDCTEDAVACVKLMNWKLNEDCKVK
nr:RNA exonuclease 1 homolog [Ciona intestinalis]|eukprot:XP_026690457.1 RNA exonuclease 1 homolog [Ciona intestinalis]